MAAFRALHTLLQATPKVVTRPLQVLVGRHKGCSVKCIAWQRRISLNRPMKAQQTTNEAIALAEQSLRETEDVLVTCLHTQLAIVSSLCELARRETGERRSSRIEQAETGLKSMRELVKHVRAREEDLDAIAVAHRNILQLNGQDLPQRVHSD